jgi:hypothetical protein
MGKADRAGVQTTSGALARHHSVNVSKEAPPPLGDWGEASPAKRMAPYLWGRFRPLRPRWREHSISKKAVVRKTARPIGRAGVRMNRFDMVHCTHEFFIRLIQEIRLHKC